MALDNDTNDFTLSNSMVPIDTHFTTFILKFSLVGLSNINHNPLVFLLLALPCWIIVDFSELISDVLYSSVSAR